MTEYPYQVFSPLGHPVLAAPADCRYPKDMELRMMDAGFTFRLHGKKLTKTDIRKETDDGKNRNRHKRCV